MLSENPRIFVKVEGWGAMALSRLSEEEIISLADPKSIAKTQMCLEHIWERYLSRIGE